MSTDGEICWKRTFAGRNPSRVLVVGSMIVCSYIDDQGDPGTPGRHRLVCLDREGHEQWSARDFELRAVLPDGRVVGVMRSGELRALDPNGRKSSAVRDGTKALRLEHVLDVSMMHDRVLVRTKEELFVTDITLSLIGRFAAPPRGIGVLVDDALLYIDGDYVMRRDRQGQAEALCRIPSALAHDAMSRWERETGRAALHGTWKAIIDPNADLETEIAAAVQDPSKQQAFGIGDRPPRFLWALSYVAMTKTLFLSNFMSPHVLVCLGLDGEAKWSVYLSPGCCGGSPERLSNGELVVSSGCGGILSWFDLTGRITRRTTPHNGEGPAPMFSSRVTVLSDSSCVVDGGPGIVSYAADATLRWIWKEDSSSFDYDEQLGILVTASWAHGATKTASISCFKNLDRRSARA